ncbi:type II secretion system F family protein [Pelagicoccus sp. NFK12]|uniref:Type II secretion system F family protein n=1 Tax=Pelagicoccus enzymogenes TaxID=2773457 RepID=A0A927IHM0_9BACT|nr:type II secretion system F family protein [Pelagicoccus enzymogenes]MBD5779954.1 type II secretion system F family protein [Pelagicoccus enzymogenes]
MAAVSDKRLAEWLEQVADGLDAGMQASNAVALAESLPSAASENLEAAFRNGDGWGDSLEYSQLPFSFAELSIMRASELSGRLPSAMRRIAASRREMGKVKRRMLLALAYPVFILHFAAVAFAIPYLVNGDAAAFLVASGMVVVPIWLIALFMFAGAKLFPGAAKAVSRSLPVFSRYRRNWDAGTLCEVLASGFAAGMDVTRSWEIAANGADSPRLYRLANSVVESVSAGGKASEAIAAAGKLAPKGFLQLYKSGEETGNLEENLEAAAKRYFTDAKNQLFLASMLYPKLLLVGIFGYVGYRIVSWVSDYFEELSKINV